ncbi:RNA polymerase sigma factor [Nannocystis sp.]|uniref:RNA polymerase sigma factor n=1 Tax=Nannocystis sp. TaxID=1962667 RepID=UPI0024277486|nr:RNA polymerase sigma factor [Nannocystis sp.]MBK7828018.1 RNA polymerase sigma factor [Nannocystis sp.]MBK9752452.1 RNA polymerase sigma factor [Nannocystis sp.]
MTIAPEPTPDADADLLLGALVERARGGDMHAWARLYQDHWARLLRHVSYLTGDVTAAEDLVQETFAQALASLIRFDARAPFFAWLRGIAMNIVRKHWRTRGRRTRAYTRIEAESGLGLAANDPENNHLSRLRAQTLLAVLDELPEHLREAFVLCDLRDMSTEDAAQELGISPGNLRVRATRARARIRVALTELGWLSPPSGDSP